MPKFHYAKFDHSWGVESVVDDATYNAARDMFAESLGIPATSLEYLLQYGVNQTTQDSMAQPAAAAKDEKGDVAAACIAAANKRWDKIKAGDASVRSGGFRAMSFGFETTELDIAAREYIDGVLKASAKKAGKKLPKGEDLNTLRRKYFEAHKEQVSKEAKRRVKESGGTVDLDELLAE